MVGAGGGPAKPNPAATQQTAAAQQFGHVEGGGNRSPSTQPAAAFNPFFDHYQTRENRSGTGGGSGSAIVNHAAAAASDRQLLQNRKSSPTVYRQTDEETSQQTSGGAGLEAGQWQPVAGLEAGQGQLQKLRHVRPTFLSKVFFAQDAR